MTKPKKKRFEVTEGKTIETVLTKMQEEGYTPVRRMEEPVFQRNKGKWNDSGCSVRKKNYIRREIALNPNIRQTKYTIVR